jgi:hypothetical protein
VDEHDVGEELLEIVEHEQRTSCLDLSCELGVADTQSRRDRGGHSSGIAHGLERDVPHSAGELVYGLCGQL